MGTQLRRAGWRAMLAALVSPVLAASCAGGPPPMKTPVTEQRPLSALLKAAAYPNSETLLVLVTMQHLLATHRDRRLPRAVHRGGVPRGRASSPSARRR